MDSARAGKLTVNSASNINQALQCRSAPEPHRIVQGQHLDRPLIPLPGQISPFESCSYRLGHRPRAAASHTSAFSKGIRYPAAGNRSCGSVARAEQRDGGVHGRLHDLADGFSVFDGQRGEFP